jgi:hypothetical protein
VKNNAKSYREIIALIGIALLFTGIARTSRADDGRDFATKSKFTKIDVPDAAGVTTPSGINPQSNIVGTYFTFSNQTVITRGFLLSRGIFYNIDVVLAGAIAGSTNVVGINPRGDIVGSYTETNQDFVGFLLSKGTFSTIEVPGSTFCPATGLNPQGDILGFYFDSRGIGHGYLLSNGIFTTIDVPGGLVGSTFTSAINARGDIVGTYTDSGGIGHGFLLSCGRFTTIDVPAAFGIGKQALGINSQGDIVGIYFDGSNNIHGYLLNSIAKNRWISVQGP